TTFRASTALIIAPVHLFTHRLHLLLYLCLERRQQTLEALLGLEYGQAAGNGFDGGNRRRLTGFAYSILGRRSRWKAETWQGTQHGVGPDNLARLTPGPIRHDQQRRFKLTLTHHGL